MPKDKRKSVFKTRKEKLEEEHEEKVCFNFWKFYFWFYTLLIFIVASLFFSKKYFSLIPSFFFILQIIISHIYSNRSFFYYLKNESHLFVIKISVSDYY